jgi:hydrogenase-4 membrane subunit HyfE
MLAFAKGKYALVNIILSLYLALLIALKFPYYDIILRGEHTTTNALTSIALFLVLTFLGAWLMRRLIPGDDYERTFESFSMKFILALMATVLVMAYSYHVLPVTDFITPGSPIQSLFAPEEHFFWWLILPLIALVFV